MNFRLIYWPITVVYGWMLKLRNHLFDLGIWKSVEFECPVINIGSIDGQSTFSASVFVAKILKSSGLEVNVHVNSTELLENGLLPNKNESFLYLSTLQKQRESMTFDLVSTSNRILGISELYQHRPHLQLIIMCGQFGISEIRPSINILVTSFDKPFFQDNLWPLGSLLESRKAAARADIVLVEGCLREMNVHQY